MQRTQQIMARLGVEEIFNVVSEGGKARNCLDQSHTACLNRSSWWSCLYVWFKYESHVFRTDCLHDIPFELDKKFRCHMSWTFIDDKGVSRVAKTTYLSTDKRSARAEARLQLLSDIGVEEPVPSGQRMEARRIKELLESKVQPLLYLHPIIHLSVYLFIYLFISIRCCRIWRPLSKLLVSWSKLVLLKLGTSWFLPFGAPF